MLETNKISVLIFSQAIVNVFLSLGFAGWYVWQLQQSIKTYGTIIPNDYLFHTVVIICIVGWLLASIYLTMISWLVGIKQGNGIIRLLTLKKIRIIDNLGENKKTYTIAVPNSLNVASKSTVDFCKGDLHLNGRDSFVLIYNGEYRQ